MKGDEEVGRGCSNVIGTGVGDERLGWVVRVKWKDDP